MKKKWISVFSVSLILFLFFGGLAFPSDQPEKTLPKAQTVQENPITAMTNAMADRLGKNLNIKHVVGDPIKVGKVTVIPIIMIDIGYGGGGGGQMGANQPVGSGFYMSGEARPLGFIVISKTGIKFLSAGKVPKK